MKTGKKIIISGLLLSSLFLCGCGNKTEIIKIHTNNAPQAIGPYEQAVVVDKTVYCSGQIAIDPTTNTLIEGDVAAQTHQVMKNIKAVLEAASTNLDNVVKATIYLTDMNDFNVINEIYKSYFTNDNYPARSAVEVSNLPKGALVEIEVIAVQK